jgi:hypothetical protein
MEYSLISAAGAQAAITGPCSRIPLLMIGAKIL